MDRSNQAPSLQFANTGAHVGAGNTEGTCNFLRRQRRRGDVQEGVDLRYSSVDSPASSHLSPVQNELLFGGTQLCHISLMTDITEITVKCQDNFFPVQYPLSGLVDSPTGLGCEQLCEVVAKFLQDRQPLRRSLDHLALRLKHFSAFPFNKHAHDFAHAPAGCA